MMSSVLGLGTALLPFPVPLCDGSLFDLDCVRALVITSPVDDVYLAADLLEMCL